MKHESYCFIIFIFSINAMEDNDNYFLFGKDNHFLKEKISKFNSSGIDIMGFMIKKKHYDLMTFLNEHASILTSDIANMGKEESKDFFKENIHRATREKYKLEKNSEHTIATISRLRACSNHNSIFGLFDNNYALGMIKEYLKPKCSVKNASPLVYLLLPHYFKSNFFEDKEPFKLLCIEKLRIFYEELGYQVIFVDLSNFSDVANSADSFFSFLQSDVEFKGTIFCINNNASDNEKFKINFPKLSIDSVLVEKLFLKDEKKLLLLYTPFVKSALIKKHENILNNTQFFKNEIKKQINDKGRKKTCMKMLNELVLQLFIE